MLAISKYFIILGLIFLNPNFITANSAGEYTENSDSIIHYLCHDVSVNISYLGRFQDKRKNVKKQKNLMQKRKNGDLDITYIILHNGTLSSRGANHLVYQLGLKGLSTHFAISQDGQIFQLSHLDLATIHSGRTKLNMQSIGIDLLTNSHESKNITWSEVQYKSLYRLLNCLSKIFKIPYNDNHIFGHYEVKGQSRGDPSNFEWEKIGLDSSNHEKYRAKPKTTH